MYRLSIKGITYLIIISFLSQNLAWGVYMDSALASNSILQLILLHSDGKDMELKRLKSEALDSFLRDEGTREQVFRGRIPPLPAELSGFIRDFFRIKGRVRVIDDVAEVRVELDGYPAILIFSSKGYCLKLLPPMSLYVLDKLISYTAREWPLRDRFRNYYYSLDKDRQGRLNAMFENGYGYFYLLMEFQSGRLKDGEISRTIELEELDRYLLQGLESLLSREEVEFIYVFEIIHDYLITRMGNALLHLLPDWMDLQEPSIDEIEDTYLLATIGLEDRCPVRCEHCSAPHIKEGRTMRYSDLVSLLDSDKVRLPVTYPVDITYSEPLAYESEGKDIVDVVELILKKGASVSIVTSGMGVVRTRLDNILERLERLAKRYPRQEISLSLSFNLFGPMRKELYIERVIHILRKTRLVHNLKMSYHNLNRDEMIKSFDEVRKVIGKDRFGILGEDIRVQEMYLDPEGRGLDLYINNPGIELMETTPCEDILPGFFPGVVRDFLGFTLYPDLNISPFCSAFGRQMRTFGNPDRDGVSGIKANTTDFFTRFLRICQERKAVGFYPADILVEAELERRKELGIPAEVMVTKNINREIIIFIRTLRAMGEEADDEEIYNLLEKFFGFIYLIEDKRMDWQNFRIPRDKLLNLVKPYFVSFFKKQIAEWRKITDPSGGWEIEYEFLDWLEQGIELGIASLSELGITEAELKRFKKLAYMWLAMDYLKDARASGEIEDSGIEQIRRDIKAGLYTLSEIGTNEREVSALNDYKRDDFRLSKIDILSRQKDITNRFIARQKGIEKERIILAWDTDIGNSGLYNSVIKELELADLGNVSFVSGEGERLAGVIKKEIQRLGGKGISSENMRVVVLTKKEGISISEEVKESYILQVEDNHVIAAGGYTPVLELLNFALALVIKEDIYILKYLYEEITNIELTEEALNNLKAGRLKILLPPTERIDADIYSRSVEILGSA